MNELWAVSIILCLIVIFGMYCWIKDEIKKQAARKKLQSSKPVEATAWIIYDSTGKKV